MRYTYDNSAENPLNPQQPPVRVLWGQPSFNEMGELLVEAPAQQAISACYDKAAKAWRYNRILVTRAGIEPAAHGLKVR